MNTPKTWNSIDIKRKKKKKILIKNTFTGLEFYYFTLFDQKYFNFFFWKDKLTDSYSTLRPIALRH